MKDKRYEFYDKSKVKAMDEMNNFKKAVILFENLDKSFSDIQYIKLNKNLIDIEQMYPLTDNEKKKLSKILIDIKANPEKKKELTNAESALVDKNIFRNDLNKNIDDIAKTETTREYYPVELFFEKQCDKKKKDDPTFDHIIFAEIEKERIESILEQIKQLSDKSYYSQSDTYEQAKKYISYLKKVIDGSETTNNAKQSNIKGLTSEYNTDQLKKIFNRLEKVRITVKKDEDAFLSIFSKSPKKLVNWDSRINGAKAGLFDLLERLTQRDDIVEADLKKFFFTKEPIRRNWKDKGGNPTRLVDKLLKDI